MSVAGLRLVAAVSWHGAWGFWLASLSASYRFVSGAVFFFHSLSSGVAWAPVSFVRQMPVVDTHWASIHWCTDIGLSHRVFTSEYLHELGGSSQALRWRQ